MISRRHRHRCRTWPRLWRTGAIEGWPPSTVDLRRAAIRFLHHATSLPLPIKGAHAAEMMAGIRRDAPNPTKMRDATLNVLHELLAPIRANSAGCADARRCWSASTGGAAPVRELSQCSTRRHHRGRSVPSPVIPALPGGRAPSPTRT